MTAVNSEVEEEVVGVDGADADVVLGEGLAVIADHHCLDICRTAVVGDEDGHGGIIHRCKP